MREVYRQLGEMGLPQAYVRKHVLPEWWDDSAALSPAGFGEAAMLLARHLGLDQKKLLSARTVVPAYEAKVSFKKPSSADAADLQLAQRLAVQVCRLASPGVSAPVSQLPTSGKEIRDIILAEDNPWVSLRNLLDYCWDAGVAVMHVSSFPAGAKHMHGMAVKTHGRPFIVISWGMKHPAWILFVLAHELGHVALGHLQDDAAIVDQKVDPNSGDDEEMAANRFAGELLCGSADARFRATGAWPNAKQLAASAREHAVVKRIDPGHIILNYANSMGKNFFPVAQGALKLLGNEDDAASVIRDKMASTFDWSQLPEEASEFVARMTQKAQDAAA